MSQPAVNPYIALPLSGFVVSIALAAAVYARSPRARVNQTYALLSLAVAYWSILKVAWRLTNDADAARMLYELSAFGWCAVPSFYMHFVLEFTRSPGTSTSRRLPWALHVLSSAFASAAFVPGLMVKRMVPEPWGYSHVPGPLYRMFTLYLLGLFVTAALLLLRARRRARSVSYRAQCTYILVGIMFPLVGGVVTNMLLPILGFHVVELAEVMFTVNAGIVAYAMIRRGLLSVSLEEAAEAIIATMADSLLVVDRGREIVLANQAAQKLLGEPNDRIVGQPASRFVRSMQTTGTSDSTLQGFRTAETEVMPTARDPVPVLLSLSPVRDPDGVPIGLVLVAKDIRDIRKVMDDLESANEKLEHLAVTDELTQAFNRRAGNRRLEEEFVRAVRYSRPLSVAVVDLDNFKSINDGLGHATGDEVLKGVAAAMHTSVRGTDVVVRWGGDEFLAIFPECDVAAAQRAGERLLEVIASVKVPGLPRVGASVGVATVDPEHPCADADALVKRADEALFVGKRAGKGRVSQHFMAAVKPTGGEGF